MVTLNGYIHVSGQPALIGDHLNLTGDGKEDLKVGMSEDDITKRWPHIGRFLDVDDSTGKVEENYSLWAYVTRRTTLPCLEMAAAYDEWADFYAWRWEQRADELAADVRRRHFVKKWTDNMIYGSQRLAAYARGEKPDAWISQAERRPDIEAECNAILKEIRAELGKQPQEVG